MESSMSSAQASRTLECKRDHNGTMDVPRQAKLRRLKSEERPHNRWSILRTKVNLTRTILTLFLVTTLPSLASSQNVELFDNQGEENATLEQLPEEFFTPTDLPDGTTSRMEPPVFNVTFFEEFIWPALVDEHDINLSDAYSTCWNRNATERYVDFTHGGKDPWCKHKYDQVFCWEPTPPDTVVYHPCVPLNGVDYVGNVTRKCNPDGTWDNGGLSNFSCVALLDPLDNPDIHQFIQHKILLNIGYIMSLTALVGAFFIFLFFKPLRCVRNNIHWNLVSSFIILYVLFYIASGTQRLATENEELKWACRLVICLINNAVLTNFFWMLIEGVYLHLLVVRAMTVRREGFWMYMLFGWGGPIIFTLIHALLRLYVEFELDQEDKNLEVCWLNHTHLEYIIYGPVIICIMVNLFILIHVIAILVSKLRASHSFEIQQYWKSVRATFILLPLLGGAYFFFILQPQQDSNFYIFYGYAQVILQSAQGFFVALFYVYMNQEVLNILKRKYRRWRERHSIQVRRSSLTYQSTLFGGTRKGSTDSGTFKKSSRLYPPGGKVPAFVPGEVVPLQCKMDCSPNLGPGIQEWARGSGESVKGCGITAVKDGGPKKHQVPNGVANKNGFTNNGVNKSLLNNNDDVSTAGDDDDGDQRVSVGVEPELVELNTNSNNHNTDTTYTSCGTSSSSPDEIDDGSVFSEEMERPEGNGFSDEPSSDDPLIDAGKGGKNRGASTSSSCPLLEVERRDFAVAENRAKWSPKLFLKKLSPSGSGGGSQQTEMQERLPAPIPEVTVDSIQFTETPCGTPV